MIYDINKENIKKALLDATKKENLKYACQALEESTKIKSHIWYTLSNGVISKKYFLIMLSYLEKYGNLDIRATLRLDEIQNFYDDDRTEFLFIDNKPAQPPIFFPY